MVEWNFANTYLLVVVVSSILLIAVWIVLGRKEKK